MSFATVSVQERQALKGRAKGQAIVDQKMSASLQRRGVRCLLLWGAGANGGGCTFLAPFFPVHVDADVAPCFLFEGKVLH
eukprot:scaffold181248_cov17-Tisochrysis_lutea.AAC.1